MKIREKEQSSDSFLQIFIKLLNYQNIVRNYINQKRALHSILKLFETISAGSNKIIYKVSKSSFNYIIIIE